MHVDTWHLLLAPGCATTRYHVLVIDPTCMQQIGICIHACVCSCTATHIHANIIHTSTCRQRWSALPSPVEQRLICASVVLEAIGLDLVIALRESDRAAPARNVIIRKYDTLCHLLRIGSTSEGTDTGTVWRMFVITLLCVHESMASAHFCWGPCRPSLLTICAPST